MFVSTPHFHRLVLLLLSLWIFGPACFGTDRFFSDITASSPNNRYQVYAKSLDNEPLKPGELEKTRVFQCKFVFTCTEVEAGKILWTRNQAEKEVPPSQIFVTDDAWTVVIDAFDELICVDPRGKERGKVDVMNQFSDKDRAQHVRHTTAGPMWHGNSMWYFLDFGGKHLFVIRPWWGRRVVVDVESGNPFAMVKELEAACVAQERTRVLGELAFVVETRKDWEAKGEFPNVEPAYLAGALELMEAIPFLQKLEDCDFKDSYVTRMGYFEGRVNPFSHSTSTLRQAVQLSLRRLGKVPRPFPVTEFEIQFEEQPSKKFVAPPLAVPRHLNASKLMKGMDAETVMALLGAPDFVDGDGWEYDLDSKPPTTLLLTWGQLIAVQLRSEKLGPPEIISIETHATPSWAAGLSRDRQLSE